MKDSERLCLTAEEAANVCHFSLTDPKQCKLYIYGEEYSQGEYICRLDAGQQSSYPIDVTHEEIVRCEHCDWACEILKDDPGLAYIGKVKGHYNCGRHGGYRKPDSFCSEGEDTGLCGASQKYRKALGRKEK